MIAILNDTINFSTDTGTQNEADDKSYLNRHRVDYKKSKYEKDPFFRDLLLDPVGLAQPKDA